MTDGAQVIVQVGSRVDICCVNVSISLNVFPPLSCGKVGQNHAAEKDAILIRTDIPNLQPPTTNTTSDTHTLRSHRIIIG